MNVSVVYYSDYWTFQAFHTFIKASPSKKNRYHQDIRIYSSADRFLSDFGDDEHAVRCANYFKESQNGKTRSASRREVG